MMGNLSFIGIFKECASLLYAPNSLTLHDIHMMPPFERQGIIDVFNDYTEARNKEIEDAKAKNKR